MTRLQQRLALQVSIQESATKQRDLAIRRNAAGRACWYDDTPEFEEIERYSGRLLRAAIGISIAIIVGASLFLSG